MTYYQIVETESGYMIVPHDPKMRPADIASRHRGVVVDPGPYKTYEEAYDAILALDDEEEEDR